ncbi:MAG: hypothetical protein KF901_29330 [Myxococcales bacterium]|nr:hypothetical protein [Myxococcales bacterium]
MSEANDEPKTEAADGEGGKGARRMPKKGAKKGKPGGKAGGKPGAAKASLAATEAEEGAPRWLCVHCGHRFAAAEAPDRCPSCMRKGGLEALAADAPSKRPAWLVPALVVGLIGVVGAGYAIWRGATPDAVSGEAPLEPLSRSQLRGYLALENADGDHADLFEADAAVEALARHASGGAAVAKAEALLAHVRARAAAGAFEPWSLDTPRDTPIRGAGPTAARLAETERAHLYPLEVALATAAALREAGIDAMIADVWAFPGDRRPPDPSGRLGYFGVAVWEGDVGEGAPSVILDPYLGHATQPEAESYRVLTDVQVAAAFLGAQALHALVHDNDSMRAMQRVQQALRLDRRSPYLRSVQAAVLIANGGIPQGIEELQAAAQLRPDGPRRNNVAGVFMATGDLEQANREVAAALEQFPEFAGGLATLGAIHLAQGETSLARRQLTEAERLEPQLLILPMLWAELHLRSGDAEAAVARAREAAERRPHDWQTRLGVARIFRAAGRFDAMRREARAVMELVPAEQREPMRQQIHQLLGPTALEEDVFAGDDDDEDHFDDDEDDLELGEPSGFRLGSSLLGEEAPSLGGSAPALGGQEGPALMLGDQSGFGLGGSSGSSTMLRLNLGN